MVSTVPSDQSALAEAATRRDGFVWTAEREPHAGRRREMLQKYPGIRELFGPCPRTKFICTALVVVQLATAYMLREAPWWTIVLVAYVFGGVVNHALFLAIHELSHNLGFKTPRYNRLFAIFINLPAGIPVAATFRYYHLLHHAHQGVDGVDTDLPTAHEARVLRSAARKTIWVLLQGFAYGLRPLFVHPKRPDRWEVANLVVQLLFDALVFHLWGLKALLYLPISSLIVMGLHPVAGHYISEHYVFRAQQETYSYYGPLNWITFNVGYHNEHHDFPYIPGSRLARLRQIAPEYYDGLMHHTSWVATIWRYITEPGMGPHARVKRASRDESSNVND